MQENFHLYQSKATVLNFTHIIERSCWLPHGENFPPSSEH